MQILYNLGIHGLKGMMTHMQWTDVITSPADLLAVVGRYLMMLEIKDILDIAILVFVFYKILTLIQSTRAASLLKGVLVFIAALMLSYVLDMNSINFFMNQLVRWGVVALIILFQPEIRRGLEEMGSRRFIAFFAKSEKGTALEQAIDQTVLACTEMSASRTGALIVFERENLLDDMVRSGTVLDAAVSSELLKNIFFVKAPMHDGAVIVRDGRVLGAGCMLPLSKNVNLSRDLGMRHRAGIGMSENSDAVVVIVSEETGSISVAIGGMLKRHLKPETLANILRNELLPQEAEGDKPRFSLTALLRAGNTGGDKDEK